MTHRSSPPPPDFSNSRAHFSHRKRTDVNLLKTFWMLTLTFCIFSLNTDCILSSTKGYAQIFFKNNCIFGRAGSSLLHRLVESGDCSRAVRRGLLIAVASLVVQRRPRGLWASGAAVRGLSSYGSRLESTGSLIVVHRFSCSASCGIFPDQEFNQCLLHRQVDSLSLSECLLHRQVDSLSLSTREAPS